MTTRRRIAALIGAGVLATTGAIAFALPSNAGDYAGKDPYATNCDDGANSVRWKEIEAEDGPHEGSRLGSVTLWWSNRCDAHWATVDVTHRPSSGYVGVKKRGGNERGHAFEPGQWTYHSRMVVGRDVCAFALGTVHWDRSSGSDKTGCHKPG